MPEREWVKDTMLGSYTDEEPGEEWHLLETGFGCRACVLVGEPGRPVSLIMQGEAIDSYPTVDEAIDAAEALVEKRVDCTQEQKTYGSYATKERGRARGLRAGAVEESAVDREGEAESDPVL